MIKIAAVRGPQTGYPAAESARNRRMPARLGSGNL